MKKLTLKLKTLTEGLNKKVLFAILILASADIFAMTAPYYLKYVIPDMWTYMHINQADFDQLNATLGYVVLATQLPGGWLADKFSSRKLLSFSLFLTSALVLWWVIIIQNTGIDPTSSLIMLYIIFAGWGVSTTLVFWSPLWKLLSQLGSKEQQAKIYGLQGSLNGLLGLLFITIIGSVATYYSGIGNNIVFYFLAYLIVLMLFLSGLGVIFFIPERNVKSALLTTIKNGKSKIDFKELMGRLFRPLKSIRVWLLAFFVLGMYMFQSIFAYYMKSYLTVLTVNAVVVAVLAGFRTYGLRMLVSGPWGAWSEKRKSYVFVLTIVLMIGFLAGVVFVLLPGVGNSLMNLNNGYKIFVQIVLSVLFLFIGMLSWFLVALRYVQINEVPIPENSYATVVAFISFVAFSSDAWFYQMASIINNNIGQTASGGYTQAGYQIILFIGLGFTAFGVLCGMTVYLINVRELKKLNKTDHRWRELHNG